MIESGGGVKCAALTLLVEPNHLIAHSAMYIFVARLKSLSAGVVQLCHRWARETRKLF